MSAVVYDFAAFFFSVGCRYVCCSCRSGWQYFLLADAWRYSGRVQTAVLMDGFVLSEHYG